MLSNVNAESVAGSWGVEKRKQYPSNQKIAGDQYTTTCKNTYNDSYSKLEKEKQLNKFSKFKTLQQSGTQIIQYSDVGMDFPESEVRTSYEDEHKFDHSMRRTSFSNKGTYPDMSRTNSMLLRTADCPVAVGRSGARIEKGVSTSGLLGERLMAGSDPKKNSFVQRSWLPQRDPALDYKVIGAPVAHMPNDVSLNIGGEHTNEKFAGWTYGRKAVLTGDVLSRSGNLRAGIFLDDYQ